MEQQPGRYFIFKFGIHISRVSIAASFQTDIRLSWRTQLNSMDSNDQYPLRNGEAQTDTDLVVEEVLQKDLSTGRFQQKESIIVVDFVSAGQSQRAGLFRLDLAELVSNFIISTAQCHADNVMTYQLTDCFDEAATISFALTELSSFEIDEAEVVSFAALSRQGSQRIVTEADSELPPMFGTRTTYQQNDPTQPAIPSRNSVMIPQRQQQAAEQQRRASVSPVRPTKKSPSPGARSNPVRHQPEDYQKFMRIIESKDELIHQLQLKIEELLQSKKILQQRCVSLEQELKAVQLDYKAVVAAKDRYSPHASKELIRYFPADSKEKINPRVFESGMLETEKDNRQPSPKLSQLSRPRPNQSLKVVVERDTPPLSKQDVFASNAELRRQQSPKLRAASRDIDQSQKLSLIRSKEQIQRLESEIKFMKDEMQRKVDYEVKQNELIQHLTEKLMTKVSEPAINTRESQIEMKNSLVQHLQQFQQSQSAQFEAMKKTQMLGSSDPTSIVREIEKIRKEYDEELKEMRETLFAEKKKNILLEEENARMKADVKRLEEELRASGNAAKRSMLARNEELQLQEQYIEQKNKELRNELQELKKSAMLVERTANTGAKAYSISEERYKVLEEELKLKISTLREELDQKQLEYKNAMHQKQIELTKMKDELHLATTQKTSLEKKLESLTQAIANEKEKSASNERKAMNYDRIEKRIQELEKFNTEIKQDYEKIEGEKKAKNNELNELKLKLQEREIEWTRLKRLEVDHRNLQDTYSKLVQLKEKNDKRLEEMERKTMKLKESLLVNGGKNSLLEDKLLRELQERIKDKDKSEDILQLENERKQLREQSEKMNSKMKELEDEIARGRESQATVLKLEEEKTRLKKQLSIDVETKLRAVEVRLEAKRAAELNELAAMTKSKDNFEQTRMKMLERQNEEIRVLTKELTKKLLDMERLNLEKNDPSEVQYNLKKKQKELRDKDEMFDREIQQLIEIDVLKASMVSAVDERERSLKLERRDKSQKEDKDRRQTTRDYLDRLKKAYAKRIDFLKAELAEHQKKEIAMFEKEKELEIRETRLVASDESKKLLKLYEAHNLEIKYLREKAERLEQIQPEYKDLKERVEKFDAMKVSLANKKLEQEENLKAELQKRSEDIRKAIEENKKIEHLRNKETKEFEGQIKDIKKQLAESKESYEKLTRVSRQEIVTLMEQMKRLEEDMAAFRETYETNTTVLVNEVEKRDDQIKTQKSEIEYLTVKLEEATSLFQSNLAICAEQQNKIKVTVAQNAELREIVIFREQENAELMVELDAIQRQLQEAMQVQQAKYEELDSNNKDEISLLHQEISRLQNVVEDELAKSLQQEAKIEELKEEIKKYEASIEELYSEALNNESAMKNLQLEEQRHEEEQRIVEEEYEKLLHDFGAKNIELNQLKNDYLTLQELLATSEGFIKKQEEAIESNKQQFHEALQEIESQKQTLRQQLKELNNVTEIKEQQFLQYNRKMTERQREYQLCIEQLKFSYEKERLSCEEARHNLAVAEEENERLREQTEVLREFKKDNERRKGKRGTEPQLREDKSIRKLPGRQDRDEMDKSPMLRRDQAPRAAAPNKNPNVLSVPQQMKVVPSPAYSYHGSYSPQQGLSRDDSRWEPPSPSPVIRVINPSHQRFEFPDTEQAPRKNTKDQVEEEHDRIDYEHPEPPETTRNSPPVQPQPTYQISAPMEQRDLEPQMVQSQIREDTHDSGEDSERDSFHELTNQLKNAELRIGEIQKELTMKNSVVQELEINNIKLKELLQQKISKRTRIDPEGNIYQGEPEDLDEEDAKVLAEIRNLKQLIKQLNAEIEKLTSDNHRYASSIKEINEQYDMLNEEAGELRELNKEKKKQLQTAQEKELEYLEEQRVAGEIIEQKETLIAEFEEMLKTYQQDKENAENMIADLQREYNEKLLTEKELRKQVAELEDEIAKSNANILQLEANRNALEGKVEALTCEFTSCRSTKEEELHNLQNELMSVKSEVKNKEFNLSSIAQKYVDLQDGLAKENMECKKLELRLQERNQKYEQALLKISTLEKDISMGALLRKDLESRVADILKENKAKEAERGRLNNQLLNDLKRMEQEKEALHKQISNRDSAMEQKELECYSLKKDIEVFNMEGKKLRKENEDLNKSLRIYEDQTAEIIREYENKLQEIRESELFLETKVRELEDNIIQHEQSADELQKIDRIRQDMVHEVERKYHLLREEYTSLEDKLNNDFNTQLAAALKELIEKHSQESSRQAEELKFLKNMCDQMKMEMEQERADIFDKQCELERDRHDFLEERSQFEEKIKRYQHEVHDMREKIRQVEKQRPTVELYEELAFQNEIFKNRIAELEHNASFRRQVGQAELLEEFEYFKAQKLREREEFLAQLDNYSNQVNELEEKNYMLNQELEQMKNMDFGRLRELEEENIQLEKEVVKLEHSQEELTNELRILKNKREDELRRHYSELRLLKQH